MEPLFFKAENVSTLLVHVTPSKPSMEPLFFKAENNCPDGKWELALVPSMEPLFFKAENPIWRAIQPGLKGGPSMEPLFFKAENASVASVARGKNRTFNGAAFFQSGKLISM